MASDYLVASLPAVSFDAPAPLTAEKFLSLCREQLSTDDAEGIKALITSSPSPHKTVSAWRDIETQLRNTAAIERARKLNKDPSPWLREADGCSLYWRGRVSAAFQEQDPLKREEVLDRTFFDAAEELTPATSPLSVGAVFTYAVRLMISLKRSKISAQGGNEIFDRLADAEKQIQGTTK